MPFPIPVQLAANCRKAPATTAWLDRLPNALLDIERRWSLTLSAPFDGEGVSCAWVANVSCADGTATVLKIGMPHMEAEHEADGLRFWNGNPTVRLLDFDAATGAMLLERCKPGTTLHELPEPEQDLAIARLLPRLWRLPPEPHPFRNLAALTHYWTADTLAQATVWPDASLVREGLRLFDYLARTAPAQVLLATDLHSGNILRSQREPWLVIDPKPFIGDPAYDATQHLFNCTRLHSDPHGVIRRVAGLLNLDPEGVRLWLFARASAEPRDDWRNDDRLALARALA